MSAAKWRGEQLAAQIQAARRRAFYCERHESRKQFACAWCAAEAFLGHQVRTAGQIMRAVMESGR